MVISLIMTVYLTSGIHEIYSQPIYGMTDLDSGSISEFSYKYNACVAFAKKKQKAINSVLEQKLDRSISKIELRCISYPHDFTNKDKIQPDQLKNSAEHLKIYATLYKVLQVLNNPIISSN